jgi:hypothetical protein
MGKVGIPAFLVGSIILGTEWIGRVIKCFELIKMVQELLTYGS